MKSNGRLFFLFILTGIIAAWQHTASAQSEKTKRYNVLFIAVDDLKPELNCYGSANIHSPNIDALAHTSTVFTRAYCQQAICGPTRASMLTGLRPDKTQVWDLKTKMREVNPGIISLPQYFRQKGYTTIGMGKIFDPSNVDKGGDSISWSVPFRRIFPLAKGYEKIAFGIYQSPEIKSLVAADGDEDKDESQFYGPDKNPGIRFSTECLEVPDDAYMDGAMANYAVDQLKELKKEGRPFMMMVGFKKPHLPFVAPKKYWDLYRRDSISPATWQKPAANSPAFAYHNGGELRNYAADIVPLITSEPGLTLAEDKQKELIHGYYACISYTDAQIGRLLLALRENGLEKNTIVVLWGDHGWHLGDHNLWCKHSNFEQATRIPLMIRMPGITHGQHYSFPVESVDIFPTLCALTGLSAGTYLDGNNLVPALKDHQHKIKNYAISQYTRVAGGNPRGMMGYSIRDNRYRLTQWMGEGFCTQQPFDATKVKAIELYDYETDPLETKNLCADLAFQHIAEKLINELKLYYQQQQNSMPAGVFR